MKKNEAEQAVRHLCGVWAKEQGVLDPASEHPSYSTFKAWVTEKGYGHYLQFSSIMGPDYDAEMWFDQELKQTWRR